MSRKMTRRTVVAGAAAGILAAGLGIAGTAHADADHAAKPTIVLVHGAFEDGSSWQDVTRRLQHDGYQVVVPAIPLRGLATDATSLESFVATIPGPVVLAGHSWGGMLISEVAADRPSQTKALVYVAAYAPRAGESAGQLTAQFPGSLLGPDTTVTRGTDLYVKPQSFRALFAADRTASDAAASAAAERPIDGSALAETAVHSAPAAIPAYAVVATQDMAIPPQAERFMAHRAGARTVEIRSAHDVTVTHAGAVADLVEQAARGR